MPRILLQHSTRKSLGVLWTALALLLAACSPGSQGAPSAAPATATLSPASTAAVPSATPAGEEAGVSPTATAVPTEASADTQPIRYVLDPTASEARYRVREQLVDVSLPNDAVGVTRAMTGTLVINQDGTIVSDASRFVVDLTTLQSDRSRRDNFVKNNTLQTNLYPTAEFVPLEVIGLPAPLPTSGSVAFQLIGDMTVHGVTRPTTWEVTANIMEGLALVGSATTQFTFADFGMTAPRVPVVLSVEEIIRLEMDFRLVPESLN